MLNFRRVKQDFSANILKDGKVLFDEKAILNAKIVALDAKKIKVMAEVKGSYENNYECEIEIDQIESEVVDSNCDCPYAYDCQHLAALVCYLEKHMDKMVVDFSKQYDVGEKIQDDALLEKIEKAKEAHESLQVQTQAKELLEEYVHACRVLTKSPFFLPKKQIEEQKAELGVIVTSSFNMKKTPSFFDLQIALRLKFRTKPVIVPNVKAFLDAIKHGESVYLAERMCLFTERSFDEDSMRILDFILDFYALQIQEKCQRTFHLSKNDFGELLALCFEIANEKTQLVYEEEEGLLQPLPCLFEQTLEKPIYYCSRHARFNFALEFIKPPANKILISPTLMANKETVLLQDVLLFDCSQPGFLYNGTFFRFGPNILRSHLKSLDDVQAMTIPKPLFGTFVENVLPELGSFVQIDNQQVLEEFVTIPHVNKIHGRCKIAYLDGEMECELWFNYDGHEVPVAPTHINIDHIQTFEKEEGILSRDLVIEKQIIDELFSDFMFDASTGRFVAKTEKKIVEFMTERLPKFQADVDFECPENLLDRFIYDETTFGLHVKELKTVHEFELELKVNGALNGIKMDMLWDCIASRRTYIELKENKRTKKQTRSKILVLNLKKLSHIVQLFDEIGIVKLDNSTFKRPLWVLSHLLEDRFKEANIDFTMTENLKKIQRQMMGEEAATIKPIPKNIQAELRGYQKEGFYWLERLRTMYLNGILADDMGLGKTLQAICAITNGHEEKPGMQTLIVCPTSLTYNWKEEFHRFNPKLKIHVVDGPPPRRKNTIFSKAKIDVLITSYTLLQKDIEHYLQKDYLYAILDEAQHIKNRSTRNAKSVKQLKSHHRLVLTGTPIENSLEDLWSLFDFLMPGFLGAFDRFVDKYVKPSEYTQGNLETLKRKIFPFIMRRMKPDVLKELPPVSHITYHCQLTDVQQELYTSYAKSAKEQLSRLVQKQGFDKVRIHVLATLTRLKQICCHPAIFAKDQIERGDSAKYEMLLDLLMNFAQNEKKAVVFSQYTKMLNIIKEDLERMHIPFLYLDGSTKNRLELVKHFNASDNIPVFLISLKAGGVGLNLTGADTVIHYDMWWNPAVENQATDRVHRIGQKKKVSAYKLITLGTIEEKILSMQDRKRGLVKQLISSDEEAISKLTWEEVLELLKT
ncbi:MAG: RNA polymerase-associated protein RapA [Chlamydiae bacterium]|nr:RNA polymerase-associated protein RapA [Chlamydiota bacterium]